MSIKDYRERKRREAMDVKTVEAVQALSSITAYTDSIAADNYPAGMLLSVNGNLMRTTQAIARGERICAQNTVPTTLAEYITEQSKE